MSVFIIVLIVGSSLLNMYADILLVSGKDFRVKNENPVDIVKRTPDKHLFKSGMIGAVCISMWMSMLYFFTNVKGMVGTFTMIAFAMFIGSIMVFHVICSKIFLMSKHTDISEKQLYKVMKFYAGICVVTSVVFTTLMIYLGASGIINMNWYHYIALPIFATTIIQFGLPKIITIKHFDSISGTLSMLISMLFIISIFL